MSHPEVILVLHNIRSAYNVGAILRTAEGLGVKQVILSGYTPKVHDQTLLPHLRLKLDKEIHKTALGAEDLLEITTPNQIDEVISHFKSKNYQILGLENNIKNPTLKINDPILKTKLSKKLVLFLGEEVAGISPSLYPLIDFFIEIPMYGQKESFNVSVAAGIAMYAIMNI